MAVRKLSPVAQATRDFYFAQADKFAAADVRDGVKAVRLAAKEMFAEQAFPNQKDENWQYTRLTGFVQNQFESVENACLDKVDVHRFMPSFPVVKLVFVDGWFSESLSDDLAVLPNSVTLEPMTDALGVAEGVNSIFANQETILQEPMASMSTMLMTDGFFLQIAPNAVLETPLYILHLQTRAGHISSLRNKIVVGENAEATLVERFVSLFDEGSACSNNVTEIEIGKYARVKQVILQQQFHDAYYFNNQFITQADSSNFQTLFASCGSLIARHQNHLNMNGEHIENQQSSACVAKGKQTIDSRTHTEHNQESGISRQLHKYVLDDQAVGVFDGMIRVDRKAQKTDGQMDNKNLVLSNQAKMNTKPQLEIYADDVACSHGSATGQVDAKQVFYLQARGIARAAAVQMITKAFLLEPVEEIADDTIRHWITDEMEKALAATHIADAHLG